MSLIRGRSPKGKKPPFVRSTGALLLKARSGVTGASSAERTVARATAGRGVAGSSATSALAHSHREVTPPTVHGSAPVKSAVATSSRSGSTRLSPTPGGPAMVTDASTVRMPSELIAVTRRTPTPGMAILSPTRRSRVKSVPTPDRVTEVSPAVCAVPRTAGGGATRVAVMPGGPAIETAASSVSATFEATAVTTRASRRPGAPACRRLEARS